MFQVSDLEENQLREPSFQMTRFPNCSETWNEEIKENVQKKRKKKKNEELWQYVSIKAEGMESFRNLGIP